MNSHERILDLSAEIKEIEELIEKAERNNDPAGYWSVDLLKSLLKRRKCALETNRLTLH